ncbi:hypothetical protein KVV02_006746 [Mortierella alpina]|uniref:Drebrin-like protein n=1 Tax=Mortierella alpina TaxID=64518 RepID=A0A9P8A3F7_MORAP|nr:hypothetical protein KVV02_006746 [Mortierella alpina]
MSLQVNFTAHGHDLRAAYEAILRPADPQTSDNWAMFGYDKGTNDLKVLGQGNGGLEELEDEFADGKIQYAFVRIIDPNTQLNKFILIGWCGDGVPESKKGLFNSHLADVSLFLKGYHLQINARCEADVTPAQILKRVNEGSGSKYSIHNETHKAERITPLQSAYKRTEIPDIAALQRNPTKPEPAPKYGLGASKPFGSTSPSTPPSSKPESRSWNSPAASPSSAASPPSSSTERSWKTSGGSSYSASSGASFNKVAPPSSLLNYGASTPNEPSMNKAQQIRMEREAREKEERERIKKEIEASENRERQAQGQSSAQKQAEERRLQEQQEREREQEAEQQRSQDRAREERAAREREEREAAAKAEEAARSAREAFKAREEVQAREQASKADEEKRQQEQLQRQREEEKEADERRLKQQREEEEAQEREYQRQQQEEQEKRRRQQQQQEEEEEQRRAQHEEEERRLQEEHAASAAAAATAAQVESAHAEALGAPPGSVSAVVLYSYEKAEENEMSLIEGEVILNVTELDVGWWSGESTDGSRSGLFPANYVEVIEQTEEHPAAAAVTEEQHHVQEAATTNGHASVDEVPSGQPSAVALYDYTAGEPNEISFLEGDVITSIEFVTDDWWSGTSTQGANGLFPSNYVELHQ